MAKKATKNKLLLSVLILLAIAVVGVAVYHKLATQPKTSNQPSANFNPQTSTKSGGQSGGVVDNNSSSSSSPGQGAAGTASPPATTPVTGSSGVITLSSPASGATITNGTIVSGTAGAGLTQVQYRIKDTVRGVIATGPLTVSNGQFSGTIQGLQPSSTTGTLEIFDYNAQSGAEENGVTINVSFP